MPLWPPYASAKAGDTPTARATDEASRMPSPQMRTRSQAVPFTSRPLCTGLASVHNSVPPSSFHSPTDRGQPDVRPVRTYPFDMFSTLGRPELSENQTGPAAPAPDGS